MNIQKAKCDQCLFTKNMVVKNNTRRTEIIKSALNNDTYFICHKSSIASNGDVCCRGFWDKFKNDFNLGRIAQRLNFVNEVEVK